MVFGLGEDKTAATKPADNKEKDDSKAKSNADEAQELLKKMQEKEDSGSCAFC